MRCSTVSGLLQVAAAAAGGVLLSSAVCAAAGPSDPASRAAPVRDAMARRASERTEQVFDNDERHFENGSFSNGA